MSDKRDFVAPQKKKTSVELETVKGVDEIDSAVTKIPLEIDAPMATSTPKSTKILFACEDNVSTPPLESCKIITPVLGALKHSSLLVPVKQIPATPHLDKCMGSEKIKEPGKEKEKEKDYSSDCSDDSGHISNENEELSTPTECTEIAIPAPVVHHKPQKSGKISDELLEKFESKSILLKKNSTATGKVKVNELNQVNLIKSAMEIYPAPKQNCKTEVTFYVNAY